MERFVSGNGLRRRAPRVHPNNNGMMIAPPLPAAPIPAGDQNTPGRSGLSNAMIMARLPQRPVAFATLPDDATCSICWRGFEMNEFVTTLRCGHYFHSVDLMGWLLESNTCPMCRSEGCPL